VTAAGQEWWQGAAIYQVYPRSFADTDGDGVGDVPGIIARLDYLAGTGFDALWLSPFYRSPMADFGYDISDHTDVDPIFGSLHDVGRLLAEAHARGLKVIIDFVPNHTSTEHPWFRESRSSRTNPFRDWYVWRDGAPGGGPPNNWQSQFPRVGPGWTFDELTGQWYLHSYLPSQPDLDWGNPRVVEAMGDVLRFWLRRGVDGFRVDVPQRLGKDPLLRDNPGLAQEPDPRFVGLRFDEDQDLGLERLRAIRAVVEEFPGAFLVGEVYVMDQGRMARYVNGLDGLHMAHDFTFLRLPWDADAFRRAVSGSQAALVPEAWPAWCLGNHDHGRIASRFGEDGRGEERARLANMLLLTLRGTAFIYQGDELGLRDSDVPPEQVVDVHDRDRARGPMPWSPPSKAGAGAGFSAGTPWLPVAEEAERLNVETQASDPRSTLSLVRSLLALRRGSMVLRRGSMRLLEATGDVLAYARGEGDERLLVVLNMGTAPASPGIPTRPGDGILCSTALGGSERHGGIGPGGLHLGGLEGAIIGRLPRAGSEPGRRGAA
jgi:alpha-glucosidase